ncbi:LOW QUALITY PROTEIN: hypothetical protein RJ639_014735 [Escallonia herrerae]|uniref:Retrotransposon gag domain-containing protein n=1 Tax=Escallonia herrerae TaxID=1293975 RepID=A0AA88VFI2_9ASTE|nr:LOW QUALITY PROTEIN: hypothetical protein RJ639_014735 [Escallonia herrerae]
MGMRDVAAITRGRRSIREVVIRVTLVTTRLIEGLEDNASTVRIAGDTTALWWKCRYTDGCDIKTWDKFKLELKRQFYPESIEDMAMINLRRLMKKGNIREYVKEYSTLKLEIPEMSER